ncbi:hypothetical protein ACT17_23115 [Mycolicibacterium conceptionense]|uniref:Uncharacterized protein n=1 Tax=Mycolicibacterium conceptionense TaxID=451644 RepID=A0A0J8U363_9MYCO|nr:hypothetical protein [Mycolicibacterium conceptionense]KMV15983.1 hypothetical protein ACT17_23115 [Mycolicibacterium conceptionense]
MTAVLDHPTTEHLASEMPKHHSDLSYRVEEREQLDEMIRYLESPDRSEAVVIVSPRKAIPPYGVSPRALAEELAGRARVYAIASLKLCWALDRFDQHRTYGGAVRITGSTGWSIVIRTDYDNAWDRILDTVEEVENHTLITPGPRDEKPNTSPTIARSACTVTPGDLARRRSSPEPTPARAPKPGPIRPSAPKPGPIPAAAEPPATVPDAAAPTRDDDTNTDLAAIRNELARVEQELDSTKRDLDSTRSELDRARQERDALSERLVDSDRVEELRAEYNDERDRRREAESRAISAASQLSKAEAHIEALTSELAAERAPVFSDPEQRLRDEVERTWLRLTPEVERRKYPLREYAIGAAFIDSLDLPQAPRAKIIEVIVEVLTRRALNKPSRAVHAHGNGRSAGTSGQMVRADGARAYRCYIRTHTPQAPRLLWWELTDGTVELALAARHDDPMP